MIPLKIKLINFLSYENTEFDFNQITCATVVGENGAGKSSFCTDAITWALFGVGSKGGSKEMSNYVKEGADSCSVEFSFLLNGNTYKVIRNMSALKNKHSVNFFIINEDGDEIPLVTGKITDIQKYIEDTLKMNYKTFTASSMVPQNKSNEFTEVMTDNERKEALVNMLDVDEWDKISKRASEDISKYGKEMSLSENNIYYHLGNIEKEESLTNKLCQTVKDLESININKLKEKKVIEENQEKIFKMQNIESEINKIDLEINTLSQRKNSDIMQINTLESQIKSNNDKIKNYKYEIQQSELLILQQEDINKAFEEEQELLRSIEQLESQKIKILEAKNKLATTAQQGQAWKINHTNKLSNIQFKIDNYSEQASALNNVPCSSNSSLTSTCPFLKMANQAKKAIADLQEELSVSNSEINPYTNVWLQGKQYLNTLSAQFSEDNLVSSKNRLIEIKVLSSKKQQLDLAISRLNDCKLMISSMEEDILNKEELLKNLKNNLNTINSDIDIKTTEINQKKHDLNNFTEIKRIFDLSTDNLIRLENQEKSIIQQKATIDTVLSQIIVSKKEVELEKNKILSIQNKLKTATLLQEACSKKSGVPALIIENAVPELEVIANNVLEKMLEGRLQLRLETQVEGKTKGALQEVLRITVLDNGFARNYNTYSGAEKFIVDLAIRIAMSKFLAHRAGASVQLFVLDEGVSCADDTNRQEIVEAIRNISSEFKKILFITHLEELKDSLEQKIIVSKDSKGSHIKVL